MTEPEKSLNVQIAVLAGWHIQRVVRGYIPHTGHEVIRYILFKNLMEIDDYPTEDLAWAQLPDFEDSIDACMVLIPEYADVCFEARYNTPHNGQYRARLTVREPQLKVFVVNGTSRSEALAQAVLSYLKWKAGQIDPEDRGEGRGYE